MNSYKWAGLGLLLAFLSCHPQKDEIAISKAGIMQPSHNASLAEEVTFIYHYNSQRAKLEWTAVKVKDPSGKGLTDALIAFLEDYQLSGICKGLDLEQVEKQTSQQIVHFTGKAVINSSRDSIIFWSALDLTMNRHTNNQEYQVMIN